jgi:multiple sugar transport system ATP-binding protein
VAVMRNGLLQHVDAPQVLYERPRNLFVAEFIGSPAMNLVTAELARRDGDVWVEFGGHRLRLPPALLETRPGLSGYEGGRVILGIRPEDLEDASVVHESHPDRRMKVVCDIREDMGSEVYVHFNLQGERVTAREAVEAAADEPEDEAARAAAARARGTGVTFVGRLDRMTTAREQQELEVEVDVRRLQFFDPESALGIYGA